MSLNTIGLVELFVLSTLVFVSLYENCNVYGYTGVVFGTMLLL